MRRGLRVGRPLALVPCAAFLRCGQHLVGAGLGALRELLIERVRGGHLPRCRLLADLEHRLRELLGWLIFCRRWRLGLRDLRGGLLLGRRRHKLHRLRRRHLCSFRRRRQLQRLRGRLLRRDGILELLRLRRGLLLCRRRRVMHRLPRRHLLRRGRGELQQLRERRDVVRRRRRVLRCLLRLPARLARRLGLQRDRGRRVRHLRGQQVQRLRERSDLHLLRERDPERGLRGRHADGPDELRLRRVLPLERDQLDLLAGALREWDELLCDGPRAVHDLQLLRRGHRAGAALHDHGKQAVRRLPGADLLERGRRLLLALRHDRGVRHDQCAHEPGVVRLQRELLLGRWVSRLHPAVLMQLRRHLGRRRPLTVLELHRLRGG